MAKTTIAGILSDLHAGLLPPFFDRPIEEESSATCSDCAMCVPRTENRVPGFLYFLPDAKCCTYHPFLPNYAVGALLSDARPELDRGRRRVREKIAEGLDTKPLGLAPPATYPEISRMGSLGFGRAQALVCPYFDRVRGDCTVWAYREAVCSTYFCKHVSGRHGLVFWRHVKEYLGLLERTLARHALLELGFDAESVLEASFHEPLPLRAHHLDRQPAPIAERRALWGDWLDREEDLYRSAHDVVKGLGPADVERLGGIELALRLRHLESLYDRLHAPHVPERLQRNPAIRVTPDGRTHCVLVAYSPSDPTRMRREVYDLLDYFDGTTPVADASVRMRNERGVTLSPGLLRRLYQHDLLVEP